MTPSQDVPEAALDALNFALCQAMDCAAYGEVALGFRTLSAGMEAAQEAVSDGEPWAPALLRLWREAQDHYAENYGAVLLR